MTPEAASIQPLDTITGFWLSVVMGALMYAKAIRTMVSTIGFSRCMGLPLRSGNASAMIKAHPNYKTPDSMRAAILSVFNAEGFLTGRSSLQ